MPLKQNYVKLSHEEHVLKLPDTYIGATESDIVDLWHYTKNEQRMNKKSIRYIPGEYKLFDELIVNAYDQYILLKETKQTNLNPVKNIKITTDMSTGEISVYNDGEGIRIEMDEKEQKYIPELIFGELLTSSNYNSNELKHVGGKNGYGAKLVNIFSKKFTIETVDNQQKFSMTFYDNKTRKDKPKIIKYQRKPYTKISYIPDYKRFKINGLTTDMETIIIKRAYDLAACTDASVSVFYNGEKIEHKTFEKYIELYIGKKSESNYVYQKINDRWEVGIALNPALCFEQISYVNGINTIHGGKHVDYIVNQITKKLATFIQKKKKMTIKPSFIKDNIIVFIKCTIDNPSFSSQTKEVLTTNKDKFGSKCDLSDKFIELVSKCGIIEKAMELSAIKDTKDMKKMDGKKQSRLKGIPKLEDANWAGTKKAKECCLILTEGDSAKSMAMAGLDIIGRDKYGVFPLKGKPMNVRDLKNIKKLMDNVELSTIRKILGLQMDTKDTSQLRYGKVLILADQDEDGSHIKGLIFNFFETLWPELFRTHGFLKSMLTPIVKVNISNKEVLQFYSLKDFEKWESTANHKYTAKYYKGLGTSTPKEAKQYFKDLNLIGYTTDKDSDIEYLKIAFSKIDTSANNRKIWLSNYDRNNTLDYTNKSVSIQEFIEKDLKHFSNSDNIRSIPSLIDGLKPSQRKIVFGCLKRNLTKTDIKVAQLAGYISEHAAYHHGEASLQGTIVNMAQNFVGSNNLELLDPVGQFGTRILGGKDSAQPRYIYTKLSQIATLLFNPSDTPILKSQTEEGMAIEPEYFVPILPLILINGTQGIGTGWSTDIPCFNPIDIVNNIKCYLNNKSMVPMKPFYRGFTGSIEKESENTFISRGTYTLHKDKIVITELPIGTWTDKYKEFLESITIDSKNTSKKQYIRYYNSYSTDVKVHFELFMDVSKLKDIYKQLKLESTINLSNMVLYDKSGVITKYNNPLDILKDFCFVRMEYYNQRKLYIISILEKEISMLEIKIRFINEFINGTLHIIRVKKAIIIDQLKSLGYPEHDNDSYNYLLKMPIYNLTDEKIEEYNTTLTNKQHELETIKSKSNKDLWIEDLIVIEKTLIHYGYKHEKKKLKIKK